MPSSRTLAGLTAKLMLGAGSSLLMVPVAVVLAGSRVAPLVGALRVTVKVSLPSNTVS